MPRAQGRFYRYRCMEKAGFLHQDDVDRKMSRSAVNSATAMTKRLGKNPAPLDDEPFNEAQAGERFRLSRSPSARVPRLTTHLSFAGRFLVCMPGTDFVGVSKRERGSARAGNSRGRPQPLAPGGLASSAPTWSGESELEIQKQMHELESSRTETVIILKSQGPKPASIRNRTPWIQTIREYFSDNTNPSSWMTAMSISLLRGASEVLPDKLDKIQAWSDSSSLFEYFPSRTTMRASRQVPLHGGNLVRSHQLRSRLT